MKDTSKGISEVPRFCAVRCFLGGRVRCGGICVRATEVPRGAEGAPTVRWQSEVCVGSVRVCLYVWCVLPRSLGGRTECPARCVVGCFVCGICTTYRERCVRDLCASMCVWELCVSIYMCGVFSLGP